MGMKLSELWRYTTRGNVQGIAFSNSSGVLAVADTMRYIYFLDRDGNLLKEEQKQMILSDASCSDGVFGFIDEGGRVYLYKDLSLWKEIYVGSGFEQGGCIEVLQDGFVACNMGCTYFDFNGVRIWGMHEIQKVAGLAVRGSEYVYAITLQDWKLYVLKQGEDFPVNEISYGEDVLDVAVHGNYLAVTTWHHLYLYDISDPENPAELWSVGGFDGARSIAFSPDGRYIAVSDMFNRKIKVFDLSGNLVLEKECEMNVSLITWWEDKIIATLGEDTIQNIVVAYKVLETTSDEEEEPSEEEEESGGGEEGAGEESEEGGESEGEESAECPILSQSGRFTLEEVWKTTAPLNLFASVQPTHDRSKVAFLSCSDSSCILEILNAVDGSKIASSALDYQPCVVTDSDAYGRVLVLCEGKVLIFDESGKKLNEYAVESDFTSNGFAKLVQDGFIVCGAGGCRKYDFSGKLKWSNTSISSLSSFGEPFLAVVGKYAVVADMMHHGVYSVDVDTGSVVSEVYMEYARGVSMCGSTGIVYPNSGFPRLLSVSDTGGISIGDDVDLYPAGRSYAFSPDCRYVVGQDYGVYTRINMVDLTKWEDTVDGTWFDPIFEAEFGTGCGMVADVKWIGDKLLVLFEDGTLKAFKVGGYIPPRVLRKVLEEKLFAQQVCMLGCAKPAGTDRVSINASGVATVSRIKPVI